MIIDLQNGDHENFGRRKNLPVGTIFSWKISENFCPNMEQFFHRTLVPRANFSRKLILRWKFCSPRRGFWF